MASTPQPAIAAPESLAPAYPQVTPLDGAGSGLVGWWKFDDGRGVTALDSSGSGNQGTLIGFPPDGSGWVAGRVGGSLSFDGTSNYVDIPQSPVFDFSGSTPFSVAFWAKSEPDPRNPGVLGHSFGTGYCFQQIGQTLAVYLRNTWPTNLIAVNVASVFDGRWRHVAVTYDGSRKAKGLLVYVDGQAVTPQVRYDTLTASIGYDGSLTIGYSLSVGSANTFRGLIGDIRIYDRQLSGDDVSRLFSYNPPPVQVRRALVVNAGADQNVTQPSGATLVGSVSDEALPPGSSLINTWRLVAGRAAVHFADPHSITTTVTFPVPGTYTLRLTSSDSELTGNADVTVVVNPEPARPPVVSTHGVFVSSAGSDAHAGTEGEPFATLERARDAIRDMKRAGTLPSDGVTVWIRGGEYPRSHSFSLANEDGGAASSPISYQAYRDEAVVFSGGRALPPPTRGTPDVLARIPAAARRHVLTFDLSALLPDSGGNLANRGIYDPIRPWMIELFSNGRPLPQARWPKTGWAHIGTSVPAAVKGPESNWFGYTEDNPSTWALTEGVYVHGMWTWLWADSYERVASIDRANKKIVTQRTGVGGYHSGHPYVALNVIEELDSPGEWVYDESSRRLYLYPPQDGGAASVTLSVLPESFITVDAAEYITFKGMTFRYGRASGIEIVNSNHVTVSGDTFQALGNTAVTVGRIVAPEQYVDNVDFDFQGGTYNSVERCRVSDTGEGGIILEGGNWKTLEPANNSVSNCDISRYSRNVATYRPGVKLVGVGMRAAHNEVHESLHQGISFWGNDHTIEYNTVYDVLKESEDAGAIYGYQVDWKNRGSNIQYNLVRPQGGASRKTGLVAIYLDGGTSGTRVFGNVIVSDDIPVQIGGGRDNVVKNNLILGDGNGAYAINAFIRAAPASTLAMFTARLKQVAYAAPPYGLEYPALASLLNDRPELPRGTVFRDNLFLKVTAGKYYSFADPNQFNECVLEQNNTWNASSYSQYFQDPNFATTLNFVLKADSAPVVSGFLQIPHGIGIQPLSPPAPRDRRPAGPARPPAGPRRKG